VVHDAVGAAEFYPSKKAPAENEFSAVRLAVNGIGSAANELVNSN
jgi:hypothetical protein